MLTVEDLMSKYEVPRERIATWYARKVLPAAIKVGDEFVGVRMISNCSMTICVSGRLAETTASTRTAAADQHRPSTQRVCNIRRTGSDGTYRGT